MWSLGANQGLIRVHIFIRKCSSRRFALRCRCCLCSPCWLAMGGHMYDGALWLWVKKEKNVIPQFVKVSSCLSDISDRKTYAYLKKKKKLWPEFTKGIMCLVTECVSFLILLLGNSESVTQCKLFCRV